MLLLKENFTEAAHFQAAYFTHHATKDINALKGSTNLHNKFIVKNLGIYQKLNNETKMIWMVSCILTQTFHRDISVTKQLHMQ